MKISRLDAGRRDNILAVYEERLASAGNPLLRDPETRREYLERGARTLTAVVDSLRLGSDLSEPEDVLGVEEWEVGQFRAAAGIHPSESLRASAVLFDVLVPGLVDCLDAEESSVAAAIQIAKTVSHVLSAQLLVAVTSYLGFVLNKIHEANAEERRRISRELHDQLGSEVAVIQQQLDLHDTVRGKDEDWALRCVTRAKVAADETVLLVRSVIARLRAREPRDGLEKALRGYFDAAGVDDAALYVNGYEGWGSAEIMSHVFLIVREAMRNALGHSMPSRVAVIIDIAPHELRASVIDDGCGFDTTAVPGGVGLASMRERAQLLSGMLNVNSRRGRGTRVQLSVPLQRVPNAG